MPKFFVKSNQINGNKIIIIGEDVNHIINVLRMRIDDEVSICNCENGKNYIANILNYQKEKIECEIIKELENSNESNVSITLFQGLPKFDKMELIIQKNIEVGVKKIVPVSMRRTIVKLNGKEDKKIDRWNKISEVAAKQSMRDIVPIVDKIANIKQIATEVEKFDIFLIAYENEHNNILKNELQAIKKDDGKYNIGILIGPEGGIDESEIAIFNDYKNVKIVTLGDRVLRTETAGLVMASNIIYELEN